MTNVEVAGLVDVVLGWDPSSCQDGELAAAVVDVEVAVRRLVAAQCEFVAEAARRGLPGRSGSRDGAGWLRSLVNLAPGQATLRAEVGQGLLADAAVRRDPDLAPAREAVRSGALTVEHAKVVLDTVDLLSPPAVPPGSLASDVRSDAVTFLVEHGAGLPVHHLRATARRLVSQLDPDGDDRLTRDEERQAAHRGLTLSRAGTGLVHLTGTLTSDCAGLLATAIDAGSAPRPAADGTPDDRSAAMRRHDSLRSLLHQVVAADGVLPSTHGAAYRLVVTVPADTLHAAVSGTSRAGAGPGTLPDGWPLSSTATAMLACSSEVVPVVLDDGGNPLDVGDAHYPFPPRIRTAITTRDRHCTWPGCTAPPPWCDTHHLQPFTAGGPTSVVNGALLCGRHHRLVHSLGLTGQLSDGTVHWNTPSGPPTNAASNTMVNRLINHLAHRNTQQLTSRRT